MRKTTLFAIAAGAALTAGCTTGYGQDPLGGLLGGIFGGGGGYNQNLDRFEQAAVEACGREASRYGRPQIRDVRRDGRDVVLVYGRIDTRDTRRDEFTCAFRSDGRIVDFDLR
ncbi:MAG: hypothetical protein WBA68_00580 [Alteraurantiacibacter sp.]